MLGYAVAGERGAGDRLIGAVAAALEAEGVALAGVVQITDAAAADRTCRMQLRILGTDRRVPISQDLGPGSRGCRLDVGALEAAVALVAGRLARGAGPMPGLMIVNKFGKHEAEGRGFRPLIATALDGGVPVLTMVSPRNVAAFAAFAGGLAEALPCDVEAILGWCRRTMAEAAIADSGAGPA